MKIGLIFPNKDRKDKTIHLGLGYIAAYARTIHTEVEFSILDTRVASKKEYHEFFRERFDLIGITILSPVLYEAKTIIDQIFGNRPESIICLGGPYVTTIKDEIFTYLNANYAIYGEGEVTFSDLLLYLKGKIDIQSIKGLIYKSISGEIILNPPRDQISDINQLPAPAYDLFKMNRYPVHRIVTSRGCPYACSFCNSSSIWQNRWRARSPENIVDEIEYVIKEYRNKTFSFNDNSFNINMERVEKFCDLILERKVKILWSTPVRVEKITPELAKKMKKAGCYNVGIGIESANNKVLASMGKQITIEEITQGIEIFTSAGIEVLGQFVIGSPDDNLDSVKESLLYAKKSHLDFVMFYSILPYKGTPQWDYVKNNGTFYTETIHNFHSIKPRIVFETSEFTYTQRLDAIKLATEAGYYCDSNDRDDFYDFGRSLIKYIQMYLPVEISNRLYLLGKHIYRKSKKYGYNSK